LARVCKGDEYIIDMYAIFIHFENENVYYDTFSQESAYFIITSTVLELDFFSWKMQVPDL
jgi:hypothetical protein